MPATSSPRRTRDVALARAARYVMPSNTSPGPSPYMGWKWSKPQTPSKPSSSASCARRTTSSQGIRCGVTSSPNRMSVLWGEVGHERLRPLGQVCRNVIGTLVVDRTPMLGDVLDGRLRGRVYVPVGRGDEGAGEAAEPSRV